jgi:CubicO group peptidase (beta-lactamase class C family)
LKEQRTALFQPGERYQYSNAGYVVLAAIIEQVSQQKYAAFLQENIFGPLNMNQTVVLDESKPMISNRALGYGKNQIVPLNCMIMTH